jgi:hypothetical protein
MDESNNIAINPYQFLGLTVNSTLSELKKVYYELSLYCHPDKGGKNEDMIVLHNCYRYVKQQLSNKLDGKMDDLYTDMENNFKNFCEEQEKVPPLFRDILDESNDFIKEFNQKFEEENNNFSSNINNNNIHISNNFPVTNDVGYGENMVQSEYNSLNISDGYSSVMDAPLHVKYTNNLLNTETFEYPISNENEPVKMVYKKDTVIEAYPRNNNGTLMIHDRMNNFGSGAMNDYMEAFEEHDVYIDKSEWNKNIGMSDEQYREILSEKKIDFDDYVKHRDDTLKKYMDGISAPTKAIDFTLKNPNKKHENNEDDIYDFVLMNNID